MGEMVLTFEMTPNFKEENDHYVKPVVYDQKGSSKK